MTPRPVAAPPMTRAAALIFTLSWALLSVGCDYDRSDFDNPTAPGNGYLTLSTESGATSLPADGASELVLVVSISPDATRRTIEITTSAGTLAGGTGSDGTTRTVTADSTGRARATLKSGTAVATAIVTARVTEASQVGQTLEIRFERALPDRLVLELTKLTVEDRADDQLGATATLHREVGRVSEGTEVTFEATRDDTGAPFGLFTSSAATSDADGRAMVMFSPAASGYTGPATLTARTANGVEAAIGFQVTAGG